MLYGHHFNKRVTPQSEQADSRQIKNSAGGHSFEVTPWQRLDRWLVLGSEGGSYYATEKALTVANAKTVEECLKLDGARTVEAIATVSEQGRAPKNDPAIFALAIAAGCDSEATRQAALVALPRVCRTGTHLFQFVKVVRNFRGWGRSLKRAVAHWYERLDERALCYQLVKYQQREGISHRDVFRLAHPNPAHPAVYRYVISGATGLGDRNVESKDREPRVYSAVGELPAYLSAFDELKTADEKRTIALIQEHRFTHEMIRTDLKNSKAVWEALLDGMPIGALTRNLGKLSSIGLLAPLSDASRKVAERFGSQDNIRKARLHPLTLLSALRVYRSGAGVKGSLKWSPVPQIVDALDEAFYLAFDNVEPTGKRTLLALDVSGSMAWGDCAGLPGLTPRDVSAALALVTMRVEQNWHVMGFQGQLVDLPITPRQRLDDVIRTVSGLPFGNTDCALPMVHAERAGMPVDIFHVYTDSETWCGRIHPHQALRSYREKQQINAKLAVVGMVANGFTIADPSDPNMMDIVGCDTATPNLLAHFAGW